MRKLIGFKLLMLFCFFADAHPGIGIVKDSRGNIYYTDLKQVWKISTDGTKAPVVTGVHTHELYMDEQDNLYGEHLWYNGESKGTWGHYVWCLKNNGRLIKEIDATEGFLTNYSFARDSSGNMYWVERFTTSRVMKKNKRGEIVKLLEGKFGFIGWLFSTKNGTLYFTERNKLLKLSPGGKLETLSEDLGSKSAGFTVAGPNYSAYGIWTDKADNIYLALMDSKKVIRIGADGNQQQLINSEGLWTICSGIFDNDGYMWVLENSVTNEVRARKISKTELLAANKVQRPTVRPQLLITIMTSIIIVILFLFAKLILNKRARNRYPLVI